MDRLEYCRAMNATWRDSRPGLVPSRVADGPSLSNFTKRKGGADLSKEMTPARDQGNGNKTCTAFALAALFEHHHKRVKREEIEISAPWIHVCMSGQAETEFFDLSVLAEMFLTPRMIPLVEETGRSGNYACDTGGQHQTPKLSAVKREAAIKNHLAFHGPVAVTINVDDNFFEPWPADKVYTASLNPPQTHAVCLTGYDDVAGLWRVKNSFGPGWSDKGSVSIAYGHCNVTKFAGWGIRREGVQAGGVFQ